MATITAQMVKELREATGAGPLDIKKALELNDGDKEKALDYLREKGLARANKKLGAGRSMNEGLVVVHQTADKKKAVLVEVNCETDFVATNENFVKFADNVVEHVAAKKPAVIKPEDGEGEALLSQPFFKDESLTIEELLKAAVADVGESIQISNMAYLESTDGGMVEVYQHFNKRIAAAVQLTSSDKPQLAYDLAMHISNLKPEYLSREDVPAEIVERERQVQANRYEEEEKAKQAEQGDKYKAKPEDIVARIIAGRMDKFFEEIVLMEQTFLKDDSKKIPQLLKENGGVQIVAFARFAIGEGSEEESGDE